MTKPRVLILRAPGANCDGETQFAFEQAGAVAERLHINRLRENPALLKQYQILVIPGGFTYGDDVASGKILANQLRVFLGEALRAFRDKERLILGICNGFQALLKAGLLLQSDDEGLLATLTHNASGKFEDRWVHVQVCSEKSRFLAGCRQLYLPVAHAEGRLLFREAWQLKGLEQAGQVVLRYVDERGQPGRYPINPNGSQADAAGLCDATGRVFGLMPHPERHVLSIQHPQWTRRGPAAEGDGLQIFRNAVNYFR
jgi:phosphoribosylformylglycinamidine synthase